MKDILIPVLGVVGGFILLLASMYLGILIASLWLDFENWLEHKRRGKK